MYGGKCKYMGSTNLFEVAKTEASSLSRPQENDVPSLSFFFDQPQNADVTIDSFYTIVYR